MPVVKGQRSSDGDRPFIGHLTRFELEDDAREPWLTPADLEAAARRVSGRPLEAERQLGHALGALIREERSPSSGQSPPVSWREREVSGPLNPGAGAKKGFGFRRLLDLVGATLAFLLIWMAYRAFIALPPRPDHSPWDLLGSETGARPRPGPAPASTPSTKKNLPPLGEFDFGRQATPSVQSSPAQSVPVVLRSIYAPDPMGGEGRGNR